MISRKSYEPSLAEKKEVNRLAKMIEDGLIKIEEKKEENFFDEISDIWKFENTNSLKYHPSKGFMMPKPDAPDNDVSYNYLNYNDENHETSLRKMSKYEHSLTDQFARLNDIYNASRIIRKKHDITEKDILPDVPEPKDLKPFPTKDNISNFGHNNTITSIAVDPAGDYVFSSDVAGFVYFSDVISTKILLEVYLKEKIKNIQYNSFLSLLAVCCDDTIYFMRPRFLERRNKNPKLLKDIIVLFLWTQEKV